MNKELKVIGVTMSLLLPLVFLAIVLINAPYIMPEQLERLHFLTLTSCHMQQYIFWATVVFTVLTTIILSAVLFYPRSGGAFVMKRGDDKLTIDKKVIEGSVHSHSHEEEFIHSPRVRTRSTKSRTHTRVSGDLERTSSLVGKTGVLIQDIEEGVTKVLGTRETAKVAVTYSDYEEREGTRDYKHPRVEWEGQIMKELFSAYKLPIVSGGFELLLTILWLMTGFLKTLLIIIMTAIDAGIGFHLKQPGIIDQFLKS